MSDLEVGAGYPDRAGRTVEVVVAGLPERFVCGCLEQQRTQR